MVAFSCAAAEEEEPSVCRCRRRVTTPIIVIELSQIGLINATNVSFSWVSLCILRVVMSQNAMFASVDV